MKKKNPFQCKKMLFAALFTMLIGLSPARAQHYYSQWTTNLVAGDNIFDITTGATHTNWATGVQATTPELLANSVTVNVGVDNVTAQIKKISTTRFKITTSSAISGAFVTAQYPGAVVAPVCNAPTLISAVRSGTNVTYTWNNNGTPFGSVSLQWSTDGGVTWSSSTGSPVSPRMVTIPNTPPIQYRIAGYSSGCPTLYSNVVNETGTSCPAPTLTSAVRTAGVLGAITFTWNNNGGPYSTVLMEYSTNGGGTWNALCSGSSVSPRTCSGMPTTAILVRIHAYGSGCDMVSNSISLTAAAPSVMGTQAVGNNFASADPKNLGCGSICVTLGSTNFVCAISTPVNNVGTGTQIYIQNTASQLVPATAANCALYGANAGTTCSQMQSGVRWIRFVNSSTIWNVNPTTGIISGTNLSCP